MFILNLSYLGQDSGWTGFWWQWNTLSTRVKCGGVFKITKQLTAWYLSCLCVSCRSVLREDERGLGETMVCEGEKQIWVINSHNSKTRRCSSVNLDMYTSLGHRERETGNKCVSAFVYTIWSKEIHGPSQFSFSTARGVNVGTRLAWFLLQVGFNSRVLATGAWNTY